MDDGKIHNNNECISSCMSSKIFMKCLKRKEKSRVVARVSTNAIDFRFIYKKRRTVFLSSSLVAERITHYGYRWTIHISKVDFNLSLCVIRWSGKSNHFFLLLLKFNKISRKYLNIRINTNLWSFPNLIKYRNEIQLNIYLYIGITIHPVILPRRHIFIYCKVNCNIL